MQKRKSSISEQVNVNDSLKETILSPLLSLYKFLSQVQLLCFITLHENVY